MNRWLIPAASLLGAGWFFAIAILLGVVIGQWADERSGLEPTFTLIGIVLGLAVALYGGYRMVQPLMRRLNDEPPE
jgi:F0F1-type ATP synthase assembly protein I